ncbi:MAG: helix-turn-helix domain-containing protein [Acidobacteriia bacterium]|nr:helix-turn-helix domain-containing protein [Terriglobia bacterium]
MRIRELRLAKGISQEALADEAGLHRTYMGSVERGERNISLENIVRIATALGVSASDLLVNLKAGRRTSAGLQERKS